MSYDSTNHTDLALSNSIRSLILAESSQCKKVSTDISALKKLINIRHCYNIYGEEEIIAYCKGTLPFTTMTLEGVIFTDRAFYFYPGVQTALSTSQTCIPYTEFASYFFTQEGPKGILCAQSATDEIRLYGLTLLSDNVGGREIRKILCKIQSMLLSVNPGFASMLDSLILDMMQKLEQTIGIGPISDRNSAILYSLMEFPEYKQYADKAAMIKAEYFFRQVQPEKYMHFAESLSPHVSADIRAKIKSIPASFYDDYISYLRDFDRMFQYKDLSNIYKRIPGGEDSNLWYNTISAYLQIRMNNYEFSKNYIYDVYRKYGKRAAVKIELYRCKYFYHQMDRVYQAIKNGTELPRECFKLRDGLGLSPLHYAIILKNEVAITYLLKNGTWTYADPCQCDEPHTQLFEYIIPAVGKQINGIEDLLMKTNETCRDLTAQIKNEKINLVVSSVLYHVEDTAALSQRMNYANKKTRHANKEELEKIAESAENLRAVANSNRENAVQHKESIASNQEALVQAVEDAVSDALNLLSEMKGSTDPFYRYLYRIYFEPNFFEQVLHEISTGKNIHLYNYKDFYFIAPASAEINLPPQEPEDEVRNTKNSTEKNRPNCNPAYGNSWFSYDAHRNSDVLKAEYRQLAKLYHPDVSDLQNCEQLFKEIHAEYESIRISL